VVQELELIEENSDSCPVDTTTPTTGGGIPMVLLLAVGMVMVVGIVYMGGEEKKPGVAGVK